jgi:hypothetical protein
MPAVMRAAAIVEKAGVSTVAIAGRGFENLGRATGQVLGIPYVPIVVYPGVILTDPSDLFRDKVSEIVAEDVVTALTDRSKERTSESGTGVLSTITEPNNREIVLSATLDDVQEEFTRRLWTDGLPIIPPTIDRIERFLEWTDRDPDEVIGVLPPERREATVWNVAVNGVMAGCRPEYLPILLAVVECLADPGFQIQHAGSTPAWEPLVVLSGKLVRQLDFNSGTGVMKVGRQANTSIGRFVKLFMRNVSGLRIPPGVTDQGAIGSSFNVVLAEDEAATVGIGWPTYRVDKGFTPDDSVVSVRSVVSTSAPIYSGGDSAQDHMDTIALLFGEAMGPWAVLGILFHEWHPLLVLGPSVAAALADYGMGKQELRSYLYENVLMSAHTLEYQAWRAGRTGTNLSALVRDGRVPARYAEGDDPDRLVPMFFDPDSIDIVVAGHPARNQSRAYINNHYHGVPTSRAVVLPAEWEALTATLRKQSR